MKKKALKESELGDNEKGTKSFFRKTRRTKRISEYSFFYRKDGVAAVADMVFLLFKEMGVKGNGGD